MKYIGNIQSQANAEVFAVASGALPDGKPVIINSDGTVSVVGTLSESVSSPFTFSGSAAIGEDDQAIVFDSNSNRVVIMFQAVDNSDYGTAVVGTVSDTSISFGTPVVYNSENTRKIDADFDSNSNKVVIGYSSGGGNQGKGIVGTVDSSDNSISFGSATNTSNGVSVQQSVTFDSEENKLAFIYRASNNRLTGRTATVSGTSISFGNEASFDDDASSEISAAFDSNRNRVVVAYADDGNSSRGTARVITTDSTPSASSEVVFDSDNISETATVFDSNSNKIVIAYRNDDDSNKGFAVVGTVAANNTISFGTPVEFEDGGASKIDATFNPDLNQVLITYSDIDSSNNGKLVVGTVSGTGISFTSPFTWWDQAGVGRCVYDTNVDKAVIGYREGLTAGGGNLGRAKIYSFSEPNLTTENFLGFTGGIKNTVTETQAVGSEVTFHAVAAYPSRATFDSSNNKIVIAYEDNDDSSHGKAVVGTIDPSDNSVSYGSPVDFESATTNHAFITFDSNSNKVVIAYQDADNSTYGTAIVGTVSGTSISFGSPVVFAAVANTGVGGITFDSASNKVVIIYEDTGNSERGTAIVGTVSGTSISFGSEATFTSSKISPAYATVSFDSTSNRVVVGYRDYTNSGHGYAAVGTVSGTSISFGTPVAFNAASTFHVSSAYDSNADKTLITYRDDGNSSYGTAIVGTVSGTSISFGSGTVFNSANSGYQSASFNSSTKNITVSYTDVGNSNVGKVVTATISGSSVSFGSTITFANETVITYGNAYDSANNRTILTYRDTGGDDHGQSIVFKSGGDVVTFGSTPDGKTATVQAGGAINTLQSSLTAGQQYFVQADGTIGTTAASPSVIAGTAVSATDLIVKG